MAGTRIQAWLDGRPLLDAPDASLPAGAAGLLCAEGIVEVDTFAVSSVS